MSCGEKKNEKLQNNHRKIIFSISEREDHFDSYSAIVPFLSLTALDMMNSTHEIDHK